MSKPKQQESTASQLAPHNVEAEEAVIGSILISPESIDVVMQFLDPTDFFIVRHQWIYEAMLRIKKRKDPLDYLTTVNELAAHEKLEEVGGAGYILSLSNKTPSALNVAGYANIVERTATRRRMIAAAEKIARAAHSESTEIEAVIAASEQALTEATIKRGTPELLMMQDVQKLQVEAQIERQVRAAKGEFPNLPTGWADLDQATDKLITLGRNVGIVGETRHGKSTIAMLIALSIAKADTWVLYCTIEMSPRFLYERMIAAEGEIPSSHIRNNALTTDQLQHLYATSEGLKKLPVAMVGKKVSIKDVYHYTRLMEKKFKKPGVVVIDTVNKMQGVSRDSQGRYEGLTNISEQLDALKLEGHLVLGLYQHLMRTDSRKAADLRPSLTSIKESRGVAQDLDIALGLFNADLYRHKFGASFKDRVCPPKHVMLEVLKLRDGNPAAAPVLLHWRGGIHKAQAKLSEIEIKKLYDQLEEDNSPI